MCGKLQWGRLSSSLQPGGFSFLATSRQLWKGCGVLTVHAGVAPVRVGAQQSPLGRPVSLWRPSPRCDKVIKETWCPAGGCVPMRNRKPSGCLPACLPAEVSRLRRAQVCRRRAASLRASWQPHLEGGAKSKPKPTPQPLPKGKKKSNKLPGRGI